MPSSRDHAWDRGMALFLANALALGTLELTPDNFEQEVYGSGKSVFIKFCASIVSNGLSLLLHMRHTANHLLFCATLSCGSSAAWLRISHPWQLLRGAGTARR